MTSFLQAATVGDMGGLTNLLAADVTFWADGGGKARGAAVRSIRGRGDVMKFLEGSTRLYPWETLSFELSEINGELGIVLREGGRPLAVMTFEVGDADIQVMRFIANPDKLKHF